MMAKYSSDIDMYDAGIYENYIAGFHCSYPCMSPDGDIFHSENEALIYAVNEAFYMTDPAFKYLVENTKEVHSTAEYLNYRLQRYGRYPHEFLDAIRDIASSYMYGPAISCKW